MMEPTNQAPSDYLQANRRHVLSVLRRRAEDENINNVADSFKRSYRPRAVIEGDDLLEAKASFIFTTIASLLRLLEMRAANRGVNLIMPVRTAGTSVVRAVLGVVVEFRGHSANTRHRNWFSRNIWSCFGFRSSTYKSARNVFRALTMLMTGMGGALNVAPPAPRAIQASRFVNRSLAEEVLDSTAKSLRAGSGFGASRSAPASRAPSPRYVVIELTDLDAGPQAQADREFAIFNNLKARVLVVKNVVDANFLRRLSDFERGKSDDDKSHVADRYAILLKEAYFSGSSALLFRVIENMKGLRGLSFDSIITKLRRSAVYQKIASKEAWLANAALVNPGRRQRGEAPLSCLRLNLFNDQSAASSADTQESTPFLSGHYKL